VRRGQASRDELEATLRQARDDIAARDATTKELDAKLADYAEMIPKWERKMEDERREEDAARKRQQDEEIARIQTMADEMVSEARREVALERDAKATVEFQLSQSFEAKARAKEQSAEMLEEESQKYRLMLPALQATNAELTRNVQQLRERETGRMQVAIEAEKSANRLRHELNDTAAALLRANDSRKQLEELLASAKAQCDRERRDHAEAMESMATTQRRLQKECRALHLAESGGDPDRDRDHDHQDEDEDLAAAMSSSSSSSSSVHGGGGGGGDRLNIMFDTVELALIKEVQAAKRVSVDYRVKLSECQQQLQKIAQEWGGTRTLLQQREQLIAQLENHLATIDMTATIAGSGSGKAGAGGSSPRGHGNAAAAGAGAEAALTLNSSAGESTATATATSAAATAVASTGIETASAAAGAAAGSVSASSASVSASVLEVVSGQRDRLRARVRELEEDVERLSTSTAEAQLAASKAIKEQDALRQRLR
jgi:hypothetical protein